jgi:hypothetical protein
MANQENEQISMEFGKKGKKPGRFEVHEHVFVSGPRSHGMFIRATQKTTSHFSHSHEGGNIPHTHPNTGPGCYTIDKDEWLQATGLRGGGRKKFTKEPSGEQMPMIERTPEENTFEVIVGPPPKEYKGEGPGVAPAVRMILGFGMTAVVRGSDEAA